MTRDEFADIIADAIRDAVAPVSERLTALELRASMVEGFREAASAELREVRAAAGAMGERVAVVETKTGQPGPPGKDGRDGFSLADFGVSLLGDGRTLAFTFADGVNDKVVQLKTPWLVDRGPWRDGSSYEVGDVVSYDGSAWTCREATGVRPGDQVGAWRLMVKRPRDAARSRP